MKSLLSTLALLLALFAPGCAGPSTYKTAGVVTATAEAAMASWGGYYDAAFADPAKFNTSSLHLIERRRKVDAAWESFRVAMNTADAASAAADASAIAGSDDAGHRAAAARAAFAEAARQADTILQLVHTFTTP
jgi:hypothetical protein